MNENLLQRLVGRELSSVEFVQDYVQLRFEGPSLTAITWPTIRVGQEISEVNSNGYRDKLCGLIRQTVRSTLLIVDKEIRIEFDDGTLLLISLAPEDYCAAEAAILTVSPREWDVW